MWRSAICDAVGKTALIDKDEGPALSFVRLKRLLEGCSGGGARLWVHQAFFYR